MKDLTYKERVLKEFEEKFVKRTDPSTIGSSRSEMVAPMDILTVRKPDAIKAFISKALDGQVEEERQWLENALDDGRPLGDLIKERLASKPEAGITSKVK